MFDQVCGGYARTRALWLAMASAPIPEASVRLFLKWGNMCDAPWQWRAAFAGNLRWACGKIRLVDLLDPNNRAFFEALPLLVTVWRGCEAGRERGISWTTNREIASQFARGKRCTN
jgi:hypothetical protein